MKLLLVLIFLIYSALSRKLIFVQNLFRHGARYPTYPSKDDFTNAPHIVKNKGELTPQGKNMHYLLGKALYKKYWKALFAGTNAQYKYDHRQIYVKSTNMNRTIQSAQAQLRGWLEQLPPLTLQPKNFQYSLPAFENLTDYIDLSYTQKQWNVFTELPKYHSVPIHTGTEGQDVTSVNPYDDSGFLLKSQSSYCPQQSVWEQQNLKSPTAQQIMNLPQVKDTVLKLKQSFPSEKIEFSNVDRFVSNYICMKFLNEQTLKVFDDPKYQKTLNYIKEVSLFLKSFHQPVQYQTTGSILFDNIVTNLKSAIQGSGPKLILYSGHDSSVALMLAAFNLTNVNCINDRFLRNVPNQQTCVSDYPEFASNFIIQLYQEDNGTHSFSLVYNNVPRKIPFCDYQVLCNVQKFYQWFDGWKVNDTNKACGIQDSYKVEVNQLKKARLKLYAAIAIFVLITIVLGVWILSGCIKDWKKGSQTDGYIKNFEEKQLGYKSHLEIQPNTNFVKA